MERVFMARAVPGRCGWELHISGVGVTEVDDLSMAEARIRSYLTVEFGVDVVDRSRVEVVTVAPSADADLRPASARHAAGSAWRVPTFP